MLFITGLFVEHVILYKQFLLLSIILVNFKSATYIENSVRSFSGFTKLLDYEVIIADNSSDVEGKSQILTSFPFVRWYDVGYNAGFARANNAGMKVANGDMFLFLNPDTIAID